jgi:hypothetical protein
LCRDHRRKQAADDPKTKAHLPTKISARFVRDVKSDDHLRRQQEGLDWAGAALRRC